MVFLERAGVWRQYIDKTYTTQNNKFGKKILNLRISEHKKIYRKQKLPAELIRINEMYTAKKEMKFMF